MGGCCCSSRRAESNRTPLYIYCPREIEEREPLSSTQVPSTAILSGALVDGNLETSVPDTYRAPPAPLPYMQPSGFQPIVIADGRSEHGGLEKMDCKIKTDSGFEPKLTEDKPSKLNEPIDEEDGCPICLEEYDVENPRIITKCEHHFHLSCILEWMERSDSCPICDQIMMIDHTSHG